MIKKKLPILMYHNFCEQEKDSNGLTISYKKFEQQLLYLQQKGYTSYHFSELKQGIKTKKPIILTFDDVTENQIKAVSLLQKYGFKATFFIPFAYIAKTDSWHTGKQKIMSIPQLKSLPEKTIELGYHSFAHKRYANLHDTAIEDDFKKCNEIITANKLTVFPVLAYPYGNFPRKKDTFKKFVTILKKNNIQYALRIGNRPAFFPFSHHYKIKRIDCKGYDSFSTFKLKLKIGKLQLF